MKFVIVVLLCRVSVEAYDYEDSLVEDADDPTLIGSSNGETGEGIAEQLVQEYMDKVHTKDHQSML